MLWEQNVPRREDRPPALPGQTRRRDALAAPEAGTPGTGRPGSVTGWSLPASRMLVRLTNYSEKEIESMPVLSKFYGIVIRMVFTRSFAAHFHAIYGHCELVVAISPLRVIQGDAPARVCELVLEWAGQHQRELLNAWTRCGLAMPPLPIAPLQ